MLTGSNDSGKRRPRNVPVDELINLTMDKAVRPRACGAGRSCRRKRLTEHRFALAIVISGTADQMNDIISA